MILSSWLSTFIYRFMLTVYDYLVHSREPSFKNLIIALLIKSFMEMRNSLPLLQNLATDSYPVASESSAHTPILFL